MSVSVYARVWKKERHEEMTKMKDKDGNEGTEEGLRWWCTLEIHSHRQTFE